MRLYELFQNEDVVGINPQAKKPYFSPQEADRANDEWINQAQVDQGDGVIIKGTDGKQYRIMTSYGNQHFEDGEVYLDGLTDPTYIDKEGYPDAAELLYYHSATGHYPKDPEEIDERNLNPAVSDYVKGKKTKLVKVKVADLDDEAIDDRFGRVIDVDTDVGVDLDDPILLDKDGKTILDGFHRVYQAKRVGRKVIPAEIIDENFADGKKKGKSRPGRVKRSGASCKGSVTSLRAKAKKYSGERGKMYHWCANMKGGKKKKKKTNEGLFDEMPLPTWMSHTSLEKMFRQEYGDQYGDYLAYMDLDSDDDAAMSSDFGDMALDIAKDHDIKVMNKFLSQMPVQFKVDDLRLDQGIQVWHLVQQPTTVH